MSDALRVKYLWHCGAIRREIAVNSCGHADPALEIPPGSSTRPTGSLWVCIRSSPSSLPSDPREVQGRGRSGMIYPKIGCGDLVDDAEGFASASIERLPQSVVLSHAIQS